MVMVMIAMNTVMYVLLQLLPHPSSSLPRWNCPTEGGREAVAGEGGEEAGEVEGGAGAVQGAGGEGAGVGQEAGEGVGGVGAGAEAGGRPGGAPPTGD